jgi:hypothetical protein
VDVVEPVGQGREEALDAALESLAAAYRGALEALDDPDPQTALDRTGKLAAATRKMADEAAELRLQAVGRIWEAEQLSLAALADRVGISKSRADQLVRALKAAKQQTPASDAEEEGR